VHLLHPFSGDISYTAPIDTHLGDFIMENDIRLPTPAGGCLGIGKILAGLAYDALTVLALIALISAPVSLYLYRDSPGESVVARCDKSAVAAADRVHEYRGHEREWRRERQFAFRRCVDESFQISQKPRP
jgi:hypothetical protein